MKLERGTIEIVKGVFGECHDKDVSEPKHFDHSDPKKYIAPFETYKNYYTPLNALGLTLIDPEEIAYPLGRSGDCVDLLLHMTGIKHDSVDPLSTFLRLPRIRYPQERSIAIYYSTPVIDIPLQPVHVGLVIDGMVVSKFGGGPIFRHGYSNVPYGCDDLTYKGEKFLGAERLEFCLLSKK